MRFESLFSSCSVLNKILSTSTSGASKITLVSFTKVATSADNELTIEDAATT